MLMCIPTIYYLTDGADFRGFRMSVTFPARINVASVSIPIFDDEVAESLKEFYLELEIPPAAAAMGVVKGSPDNASVSVADEDGKCCPNPL